MNTKLVLILSALTFIAAPAFAEKTMQRKNEKKLYVGANSTEAMLTYTGIVEHESKTKPSATKIKEIIESQIEHTIGPMAAAEYTSVPKGDHKIYDIKILSKAGETYTIEYSYTGTVVLENGPKTTYDIILAKNPKKIYAAGFVGDTNPCTDEHYQSEGDFWYFWTPENAGCKLKKDKDYLVVKAKVERFANTVKTYPEYHNLPDENGNINIHIFFGLDDSSKGRNAETSGDLNAEIYRDFKKYLLENGYTSKKWTVSEVSRIAKTKNGANPYVETLTKGKLSYRLFFGSTAIDEDSLAFHWFFKDAIENSSVMLYGGHSGLGGHLDLASIEESLGTPINFTTKKYQIFFFDSCTSYKYYNTQYFDRKATAKDPYGTKKLDIFTNGLSTYFHVMPESNRAIAIAFEKALGYAQTGNAFVSYQSLAKQIDSDNLFGISGDDDNETPKKLK